MASDDIGGVKHQRVKAGFGADGEYTDADATHGLPVEIVAAIDLLVHAASLPLPTGAATQATLASILSLLTAGIPVTGNVEVVNDVGSALPISASSLPLPTGAATQATLAAVLAQLVAGVPVTGSVEVANDSGSPLPVSGTVTANAGTNLNTSALATQATLAAILALVPAALGVSGGLKSEPQLGKTLLTASFEITATGELIAAVTSKRIKVHAMLLGVSAAMSFKLNDNTGTPIVFCGNVPYAANGGFALAVNPPNFLFATPAGKSLNATIVGTGTAAGFIAYHADDAT